MIQQAHSLGIYLSNLKTYFHADTCTHMFIVALFIITKNLKQPRCPSKREWINEKWYIHIVEYYLVMKWHELAMQA